MEEIKGVPDLSVRFSNSKNNIQINSKLSGSQSINFQEILTNAGEPNQNSVISTNNQSINIDSLQQQNNENDLSQNSENKNINNDKNASTSIKSENSSGANTSLFSEYIPQKPVEVDNKNLNLNSKDNKESRENLLLNKSSKKTLKNSKTKNKTMSLPAQTELIGLKENYSSIRTTKEELTTNLAVNKKDNTSINTPNLKNHNSDEKDEEKKRSQVFYYDEEIDSHDISEILNSYGLEIPEFISKGGDKRDENWVKNLIFGSLKENMDSQDSEKISKFIAITNPEQIAEKDKKVFTRLVNEMFKHQVKNINPEVFNRFEKNSSEFILKNFPHIIYNGVLKKYFDNEDMNIKKSRLKLLISFVNNEKIEENDIKNSLLTNELEESDEKNLNLLLKGQYTSLSNDEIYKSINKSKSLGISFGSFIDNIHQLILESYESKLNEKFKQTVKILNDYRQYNFINENESHFLANSIINKYFQNSSLSQNRLTDIVTNLIKGEYVEPLYLDLINQSLSKNLLSYLPNTINYEVSNYLKSLPFYKNEVEIQEEKETFKIFIKVKSNLKIDSINIYNNDDLELITFKTTDNNILFTDLETGSYKIKSIQTEDSKALELSKFDKNFSLDFHIDKKIDIFYFGTIEIKYNKTKDSLVFKLKNEYQGFLNSYKKKYPELFKNNFLKVNPKLFK